MCIFVFGLLFITGITAEENGTHWVVTPNAVIPGQALPVTISFYNTTNDVLVRVDLIKDGHHLVTTKQQIFEKGKPGIISVQVPDNLDYQGHYTLLVRGLSGLYFNEEAQLRYDTGHRDEKFFIFIQTDKAIYKPGQTVLFRAFGVFSNMSVYTGALNVSIYDTKNNKIKQWINVTNPDYGVIENHMVTDIEPLLGDWNIEVNNDELGITERKSFTIEKYVLPKFDASLALPPYILTSDKSLTGKVNAKYTYGKPVTGIVLLRADTDYHASPWKRHGDEAMVEINFDINGEAEFTVPLDRLVDEVDPYSYVPLLEKLAGRHLIITASVTEGLNNITRNTTDKVKFYSKPYNVEFDRDDSPSYFKPGLPYTAYVTINQADGKPVVSSSKDVKVTVYTKFYDETIKNHRARVLSTTMYAPPDKGKLAIDVDPPVNTVSLHMKVSFKDFTTTWTANSPSWFNPNGTFHLEAKSEHAAAGRNAEFEVLSVHPITEVFYMVVANKLVVYTGSSSREFSYSPLIISFPVTRQMEPYSQLIVYYFMDNGTWSADSVYFNVNDGALIFKNKVYLDFSSSTVEPGNDISLRVKTDPNSLVNVLAVDQSIMLVKKGNDITQKDVIESVRANSAPPDSSNFDTLHNPKTVMQITDIQVLTNVKGFSWAQPAYKQEQCERETPKAIASGRFMAADAEFFKSAPPQVQMAFGARMMNAPAPSLQLLQDVERIRKDFRETWLWTSIESGADGNVTIFAKVPDTITSWMATAFSINTRSGLGIADAPAKLRTFRSFFVSISLPYSVIRGEEFVLLVHVFNYMEQDLNVVVTLDTSSDFKVAVPDRQGHLQYVFRKVIKEIMVPAEKAETIFIPLIPVKIGNIEITVKAQSALAADGVTRRLLVEPEGIRKDYNIPVMITAGTTLLYPLKFPETLVNDSQHIRVSAIGDVIGPTLNNLHNLLSLPTGNAETTMANFAPDVYIANYLDVTGQLKDDIRQKTIDYMEKGYQRILTFQRPDGSFGLWENDRGPGNVRLTAFVAGTLRQATKYIFVSDQVLKNALEWILTQQTFAGSFTQDRNNRNIVLEGESSGRFSLTASVLIALMENSKQTNMDLQEKINTAAARARAYLETNINDIQSMYDLAIVSFALRLSGSSRSETTYSRLDKLATVKDGMKYWLDPRLDLRPRNISPQRWFDVIYRPQSSQGVVISSYALLYNIYSTHDPMDVLKIFKWIISQRNEKGGFSSTEDTVVALKALSKYTALTSGPLDLDIDVTVGDYTNRLHVSRNDALVLKTTEIPKTFISNANTSVQLSATGSGTAFVQISVSFHVEQEIVSPLFNLTVNITQETLRSLVVETCFKPPGYSGTTVLEFGVPSGFTVELSSPKTERHFVKKTEVKDRMVILYYDELPFLAQVEPIVQNVQPLEQSMMQRPIQKQKPIQQKVSVRGLEPPGGGQSVMNYKPICATLEMIRTELVAKSRPAAVKMFEYNNPDNRALVFYESQLLKQTTFCDICPQCGCQQTGSAA